MKEIIVSKNEAAEFFGVSTQALDGWFIKKCPVHERDERGRIKGLDLSEMTKWRIGQISDDELTIEKTRLTKAQADKTELEVSVLQAKLIPVEQVERIWAGLCSSARNKLLAIPYKVAFAAQGTSDFQSLELSVKGLIYEVMETINNLKPEDYVSLESVESPSPSPPPKRRPRKSAAKSG